MVHKRLRSGDFRTPRPKQRRQSLFVESTSETTTEDGEIAAEDWEELFPEEVAEYPNKRHRSERVNRARDRDRLRNRSKSKSRSRSRSRSWYREDWRHYSPPRDPGRREAWRHSIPRRNRSRAAWRHYSPSREELAHLEGRLSPVPHGPVLALADYKTHSRPSLGLFFSTDNDAEVEDPFIPQTLSISSYPYQPIRLADEGEEQYEDEAGHFVEEIEDEEQVVGGLGESEEAFEQEKAQEEDEGWPGAEEAAQRAADELQENQVPWIDPPPQPRAPVLTTKLVYCKQKHIPFSSKLIDSRFKHRWQGIKRVVHVAHDHDSWGTEVLDPQTVKHLEFEEGFFITARHIVSLTIRPKLLNHLVSLSMGDARLASASLLNDQSVSLICMYGTRIRSLKISGAPQLGDISLLAACRATRKLRSLHLNGSLLESGKITTQAIERLIRDDSLGEKLQELFLLSQTFSYEDPVLFRLSKARPYLVIKLGAPVTEAKFSASLFAGQTFMTRTLKDGVHMKSEAYDQQWKTPMSENEREGIEMKLGIKYGQARVAEEDFNEINW